MATSYPTTGFTTVSDIITSQPISGSGYQAYGTFNQTAINRAAKLPTWDALTSDMPFLRSGNTAANAFLWGNTFVENPDWLSDPISHAGIYADAMGFVPRTSDLYNIAQNIQAAGWDSQYFASFMRDYSAAHPSPSTAPSNEVLSTAYQLFREGWQIVPTVGNASKLPDFLDTATNRALATQTMDTPRETGVPGWVAVRFRDQPTRANVTGASGTTGSGGTGTTGTGTSGTGAGATGQTTLEQQLTAYQQATEWATERAQAMTPEYLRSMMTYATRAAGQIDTRTQQAYAAMGIEPQEILGGMEMAMSLAQEYMGGNVPQDVQDQMQRALAERNINVGLQGPIADMSYARNLGLTTMQLQNYGMQQYPQLAQQTMALGQAFMPGTANLTGIYSGLVGSMAPYWFGAGQGIGQTMAQTIGSMAQQESANNIAMWQTMMQMNNASQTNAQNLAWQSYQNNLQMQQYQAAQRAAQRNNYLQLGAGIVGSIIGGPIGGAIGSGIGNWLGGSKPYTYTNTPAMAYYSVPYYDTNSQGSGYQFNSNSALSRTA